MVTQTLIPVRYAIPQEAMLSPEIAIFGERNIDVYRDSALLVELANGFWGMRDGNYLSPEFRQAIYGQKGRGEWTADHIDFDAPVPAGIVVPKGYKSVHWTQLADRLVAKKGKYHAEGGTITRVELPPTGWQVPVKDGNEWIMFHPVTGSPLSTVSNKEDAERLLKDAGYDEKDVSYFYSSDSGLRAVLRGFYPRDVGPFYVNADYGPDDWNSNIGDRSCRRSGA